MRMHSHELGSTYLRITILSCVIISICLRSSGQTIETYCYDTGNFTKNSAYDQNRNIIFSSLAFNVRINGGLYFSSFGDDPDKIYVVAGCSGDSSPEACASCINSTARDMITNCPNQKEVISWGPLSGPPCTARYANRSFFEKLELYPNRTLFNARNITSISMTEFDKIWDSLMNHTLKKASMGSSRLKFASGQADLTSSEKIYTRVQCSPDLSPTDCDYCLRDSADSYQSCCHGRAGGSILRPSCNFRWEMYPFYNATAEAPTPSPPTADTPGIPPPLFTDAKGIGTITLASEIRFFVNF